MTFWEKRLVGGWRGMTSSSQRFRLGKATQLQGLLMGSPGSTGTPAVLPKQAGGEEMVLPGPLE